MPDATGRFPDLSKLSLASRKLLEIKRRIESTWEEAVRSRLQSATKLNTPILMDSLPEFLENLAEALTPHSPRAGMTERTIIAAEHGKERAQLTSYNIEHLVIEYQILRQVIVAELEKEICLSKDEVSTIDLSIIMGIKYAISSFSNYQTIMRKQFIAALSHDLRSPLGAIIMAVETLQFHLKGNTGALKICELIITSARKGINLLNSLLDVILVDAGGRLELEISECDLKNIVFECVNRYKLDKTLKFEVKGGSAKGYWGCRELERAIDNLLSNAVKYGDRKDPIRIEISQGDDRAAVSVHNSGNTIPPEEQELIFQAFKQGQVGRIGASRGWGIGLALVKGISEAHGGNVILDSAPERGTTFTIDIPKDSRIYQENHKRMSF